MVLFDFFRGEKFRKINTILYVALTIYQKMMPSVYHLHHFKNKLFQDRMLSKSMTNRA